MQGFGVAPIPGLPWLKGLPVRCAASSPTCSDFNQPTDPGGLREVLDIAASYRLANGMQVPIWITENGIADANDRHRAAYIVAHLREVHRAIADGVDVRGYMHWTLLDNFEWAEGFTQQFGLATRDRQLRPSAQVYAAIARANALSDELLAVPSG
jgi:beta-galactosidase